MCNRTPRFFRHLSFVWKNPANFVQISKPLNCVMYQRENNQLARFNYKASREIYFISITKMPRQVQMTFLFLFLLFMTQMQSICSWAGLLFNLNATLKTVCLSCLKLAKNYKKSRQNNSMFTYFKCLIINVS